jgi:hypothetical protein
MQRSRARAVLTRSHRRFRNMIRYVSSPFAVKALPLAQSVMRPTASIHVRGRAGLLVQEVFMSPPATRLGARTALHPSLASNAPPGQAEPV